MISLYFDGGLRKSANGITYGVIIKDGDDTIFMAGGCVENCKLSSNVAEYVALIVGLTLCVEFGINKVDIFGDSLLVVKQMNKQFAVKDRTLKFCNRMANAILEENEMEVSISWIPREKNREADRVGR